MDIITQSHNGTDIAIIRSDEVLITDVQSALDLLATVSYQTGTSRMIIPKSAIIEDFFDLKTRLAGDILQKFINYQMKLAIVGDYSSYTSNSLKDFIYESNHGKDFFFLASEEQAIETISR